MNESRKGQPHHDLPVVALPTFIEAIRDSGYRSPAHALAELIDNALEADARRVEIMFTDDPTAGQRVIVADDGHGMTPSTLQLALQFGGSTRFNSRRGTGRYGMGLPCGALSHARRIDVYSWTTPRTVWWTYLSVDDVVTEGTQRIPVPGRRRPPISINTRSGTVVVLSECDRPLRLGRRLLAHGLGRIFRRNIVDGASLVLDGEPIQAIDPLHCEELHDVVRGTPYGPPIEFSVRAPDGDSATISVRFAELPVRALAGLSNTRKAAAGITKGAGVSVLRADREIDYGWFFMGSKRKENYDDWWRCEVAFDPRLDELFGLTHTKQRINPSPALTAMLAPQMEAIARTLNRRTREAFQDLARKAPSSPAARRAASRDALLEPPRSPSKNRQPSTGVSGIEYRTMRAPLSNGELFDATLTNNVLTMTINTDHSFYERLLRPLAREKAIPPNEAIAPIELLLLGFCRAQLRLHTDDERLVAAQLRHCWADALTAYIG